MAALLANALIVGTLLAFMALSAHDYAVFYRMVQEDEALEWATFWAFLGAAGLNLRAALRQHRAGTKLPWFFAGVASFCFLVAMEEISWGQRLLGYRPPRYFLAHNYQLELNVHNVVERSWSSLALQVITLGYGVVLPVLALLRLPRRWLERLSIRVPSILLAPAFVVASIAFETYPVRFAGEVVECMLGLAFLFALLLRYDVKAVASSALLIVVLAFGSAFASQAARGGDPQAVETATLELDALRRDFLQYARRAARLPVRCGFENRLYTFRRDYRADYLSRGAFAALRKRGLPQQRREFFLDPWNTPYWLRHKCSDDGSHRIVYLYSFGPNRRRDSTDWERGGDDLRMTIRESRRE